MPLKHCELISSGNFFIFMKSKSLKQPHYFQTAVKSILPAITLLTIASSCTNNPLEKYKRTIWKHCSEASIGADVIIIDTENHPLKNDTIFLYNKPFAVIVKHEDRLLADYRIYVRRIGDTAIAAYCNKN